MVSMMARRARKDVEMGTTYPRCKDSNYQKFRSGLGIPAPWYCKSKNRSKPSRPIPVSARVFPGGTNQVWRTGKVIPRGTNRLKAHPSAKKYLQATQRALLSHELGSERLYFRYTYRTNGKRGPGARAIIRAVHDFDPSVAGIYTYQVTLTIGADGRVHRSQPIIKNKFK